MKNSLFPRLTGIFVVMALLSACGSAIQPTPAAPTPQAAPTLRPLPLAVPGPFKTGLRQIAAVDPDRQNRPVNISIWYPTRKDTGSMSVPAIDAEPDRSGAPYPLILSSTKVASIFAPYLVSRGFTWASVDGIDTYMMMNEQMIDQPLDILFALNQVAAHPPHELEGVMDADKAGAIGYSFDGYNALAVSGARIDSKYYLAQCPNPDPTTQAITSGLSAFSCVPASEWDKFSAHAGRWIAAGQDGLWGPMTDRRIRAVMPLAGEGWWLFGERGLAAVDRPILILVASQDELYKENRLIFEHLGTPDKTLISFIDQDHMMVYDPDMISRMAHFAAAFFGYHLQGQKDLARYFSRDFVAQSDGLAWGVYSGP